MTRTITVSCLKVFLFLSISLVFFSTNVSAQDSNFSISDDNTWSVEYLDGNSMENLGNESASDGDYISLKIPVSNSNLSSEDGSWSFSFGFGGQWYGGHSGILSGNTSTTDVEISFGPVIEGFVLCKLQVDGTAESEILEVRIGPNPVNFSSAGSEEIVIIGQPVHVGDELTASILVHNKGSISDSVRLELSKKDGTILVIGDYIVISPGSSRDVAASFIPLLSGSLDIEWRVSSMNGGIDISLNGTSKVEIRDSQNIDIVIEEKSWSLQRGLNVDISVFLSPGLNRSVDIQVFMKSGTEYIEYQFISIEMNPGQRIINFNLGQPDANRLKITVSSNGWLPLNGDAELVTEIIPPLVVPSIIISDISPTTISYGDSLSINYTLENSGTSESSAGILRIVAVANNLVLDEISISPIMPGGSFTGNAYFSSWEFYQTTDIEFFWIMEDVTTSKQASVEIDNAASNSFKLPFSIYAAIYGSLSGLAIVMTVLVIYRAISQSTPSTDSRLFRGNFLNNNSQKKKSTDLKKEVSCPSCNQRLNIPVDHTGAVKCPACSTQFSQLQVEDQSNEESIEESIEEVTESVVTSSSMTDLLSCPQCEQTLRVALNKRPVRSRCPACRVEFLAKIG